MPRQRGSKSCYVAKKPKKQRTSQLLSPGRLPRERSGEVLCSLLTHVSWKPEVVSFPPTTGALRRQRWPDCPHTYLVRVPWKRGEQGALLGADRGLQPSWGPRSHAESSPPKTRIAGKECSVSADCPSLLSALSSPFLLAGGCGSRPWPTPCEHLEKGREEEGTAFSC